MARVARVARGLSTHRLSGSDQAEALLLPHHGGGAPSSLTLRGPSLKKGLLDRPRLVEGQGEGGDRVVPDPDPEATSPTSSRVFVL